MPPASHQQKFSILGICGMFDVKNYFCPVMPEELESFEEFTISLLIHNSGGSAETDDPMLSVK